MNLAAREFRTLKGSFFAQWRWTQLPGFTFPDASALLIHGSAIFDLGPVDSSNGVDFSLAAIGR
jgi:hypothetical protein